MRSRREVLRQLAVLTGSTLLPWRALPAAEGAQEETSSSSSDALGPLLPQRVLGRTGMKVTMLAVGGSHVGQVSERSAERIIETAIAQGVRTFDTAELYQRGVSEERYGRFLTPKYREHVHIFTKTMARDRATAERHLAESLRRLRTEYLDLWQLHDIRTPAEVATCVGSGGALEAMLAARAAGKVRHIGFTGHANWRTHVQLLRETDAFETCLMPINLLDPSYESFVLNVLPILVERSMGVQAMKTLAFGGFFRGPAGRGAVIPARASVQDALRFVWSLPVHTLVSGMDSTTIVEENARHAREFVALTETERGALIDRVADIAAGGAVEWYKN